jgi:hypothetical protein
VQQFAAKSRTTLSRDLAEVVADEVGIKTSAAELGRVARQAYLRDALTERVEDRMTLEDIKEVRVPHGYAGHVNSADKPRAVSRGVAQGSTPARQGFRWHH